MVGGSLFAGEANQYAQAISRPRRSGIGTDSRARVDEMNKITPFGSRSTADQVLAGIDLSRKRVLVSGCNSAIGLETMKALSANGAAIIGVARTLDDAQAACSAVGRSSIPLGCDPADAASVDAAVESLRRLGPLDAVIVHSSELQCFADHIAQFVLVNHLAELVRSGTGRIVIGSDDTSMTEAPVDRMFDELNGERIYDSHAFLGRAKLTTALFAKELSRRLQGRGVAVNVFHSGVAANRRPAAHAAQRLIRSLQRYFTRSPAQRAATAALLAASPLVAGMTGEYWSNCQMSRGSPLLTDAGLAKRLWDVSAQIAAMMLGRGHLPPVAGLRGDSLLSSAD
jgi:NAD(P)-dependent dehydrogenase (short-subunit alcohol dehydrogenase family)